MFDDANDFNDTNLFTYTTAQEVMQEYSKHINFGEKKLVLDLGSGSGNVSSDVIGPVLHPNFRLVGVDLMQSMVDFANSNVKDPRYSFRVLDLAGKNDHKLKSVFSKEELNTGFDLAISFFCAHWTMDYEQFYKNIYNLLMPGGHLLVVKVGYTTAVEIWNDIHSSEKWQPYLKSVPIFKFLFHDSKDPSIECIQILKNIGFQDITCDYASKPYYTPSPLADKAMAHNLRHIDPYITNIPEDHRDEYMHDVLEIAKKYLKKTITLPYTRIVVIAKKPTA